MCVTCSGWAQGVSAGVPRPPATSWAGTARREGGVKGNSGNGDPPGQVSLCVQGPVGRRWRRGRGIGRRSAQGLLVACSLVRIFFPWPSKSPSFNLASCCSRSFARPLTRSIARSLAHPLALAFVSLSLWGRTRAATVFMAPEATFGWQSIKENSRDASLFLRDSYCTKIQE